MYTSDNPTRILQGITTAVNEFRQRHREWDNHGAGYQEAIKQICSLLQYHVIEDNNVEGWKGHVDNWAQVKAAEIEQGRPYLTNNAC